MTKIITIAGQKGGLGKSTIAAHLAVALSQAGSRVLLVDIDPQASLKNWYQIRENTFGKGYTGVTFLESAGWRVTSTISTYKDRTDYIVIDSPPHTELETKNAIRIADLVIIPMQASPTDVWSIKSTIDFAISEGKDFRILLNRYNPNAKIAKELVSNIDNKLSSYLGNRVVFSSCFMQGKCVTETDPSSLAAMEVRAFTDEVLQIFNPVMEEA
jgi:chromosome partitioning protein